MASLVENDFKTELRNKYTQFLLTICENEENETYKYDIEQFLQANNDNDVFLSTYIQNFLIHIQEILELNIDFFATQKKYVFVNKKGKKLKKRNPRRSYIFGSSDDQLFSNYLISNKKFNYKLGSKYLQILNEIIYIITFKNLQDEYSFHNDVIELIQSYENSSKYNYILDNINSILSTFDEDEAEAEAEVEDDPSSDGDEDKTEGGSAPQTPFNIDFIKNSQIGKLAEEISQSINPSELNLDNANPADIMKSLFSGGGGDGENNGLGNLVTKVFSEVEQRISSNAIDENALANEAKSFLGNMNGGGGGMPDLGGLGNIAEIFGSMGDFTDGSPTPNKQK